jgi:hypothetical protein
VDLLEQILIDLAAIRDPDGKSLKILTNPDSKFYKMAELIRLEKTGVYSASDPAVVEEAKKLAANGGVWIVLNGADFELFGLKRRF